MILVDFRRQVNELPSKLPAVDLSYFYCHMNRGCLKPVLTSTPKLV